MQHLTWTQLFSDPNIETVAYCRTRADAMRHLVCFRSGGRRPEIVELTDQPGARYAVTIRKPKE